MNGRESQDCAEVRVEPDGSLRIGLADGVGGLPDAAPAARQAVADWLSSEHEPALQMALTDSQLSHGGLNGETTAIFVRLGPDELVGASVGDSHVWWQEANGVWRQLTEGQRMRPFVGSGESVPIPFSRLLRREGRLLVCSDGLYRDIPREQMYELAERDDADGLLLAPRTPVSRDYTDDVSFVLVRWGPSGFGV